ncbi:MAG: cytochrome P450 [Polyangiaceae bacterium]|nr:cytochrome P450 [Polyangiaceae bacterium]
MALPPGPPIPAIAQTIAFILRPAQFIEWCRKKYGDIFTIDTLMFGREVEIVNPDLVKQVFTTDPDIARAGEANEILAPLVGHYSVLLLDGREHVRQRKLMMPPFHGEHVLGYGQIMRDITEKTVANWPAGVPFSMHPSAQHITLEVILRTVFGAEEGAQLNDLRDALTAILDQLSNPIKAIGQIPKFRKTFFGLTPWDDFLKAVAHADKLIYRQIARRRAESETGSTQRKDVLTMLLAARDEEDKGMTDQELRDELVTLLVAGHETTATMLCWAFDLILSHPDVYTKLLEELQSAGGAHADLTAINRLPYLDATIKEVLRFRPVIPAVGRRLKQPVQIGEYEIPAGEMLVPVIWLTQHASDVYPDAATFKPERFIDAKPDLYSWYPFGGGSRRCLGMAFALYEMKVILSAILTHANLKKAKPELSRVQLRGFTFVPHDGAQVVMTSRRPASVIA